MPNWLLYTVVIGTWGTSWLGIKFQLGEVDPRLSVAYRFILAGVLLLSYCLIRRKPMRFSLQDHLRILLLAAFLFSINYMLIYFSSGFLLSGLESIIFSTLTFMNIFNARIFLKQKTSREVLLAVVIGFSGILLIFSPELRNFEGSKQVFTGVMTGIASAYVASLGNIISAQNQKHNLPVLQSTAYGMFYGGLLTLTFAYFSGAEFAISTKTSYWISLLFLSIFASILAFVSYLTLLGRIGPGRAGYCVLAFPMIAVFLSIIFENYHLELTDAVGMVLIIFGNCLVMMKPKFNLKKASIS